MIKLETLSGKPYDQIYLNETDTIYMKHVKKPWNKDYPEYDQYTMYVKNHIKL